MRSVVDLREVQSFLVEERPVETLLAYFQGRLLNAVVAGLDFAGMHKG